MFTCISLFSWCVNPTQLCHNRASLKHCCCSVAAPWLSCETGTWVPVPQPRSSAHLRPPPQGLLLLDESFKLFSSQSSASHVGTFSVMFPQVVRLVAHGNVADAWRSRIAPFAMNTLRSWFPWNSLVARLAKSIKATRTRSSCDESRHFWICPTGVGNQTVKDQKPSSNNKPGCPGGPGGPG